MKRRMLRMVVVIATVAVYAAGALGHGGGLDKNGCHTDRKTGQYHCHRTPPAPAATPRAPLASGIAGAALTNSIQITDLEVLLSVQHLLKTLGYVSGTPSGTVTADLKFAVRSFRAEYGLDGGDDKINGALLLQLSQAVSAGCTVRRP